MRVNAWNEWDRLTHVIVGRADNGMVQAEEPSVIRDFPEHAFPRGTYGRVPAEMVARANELLDNFALLLERRGIRVDRPTPLDFSQPVSTPEWTQATMAGCMPPRDLLITLGNEVLEATMSARSRWFEYLCYRPLIERDPRHRWLLRTWIILYAFVGIQMGWNLRPFIGAPDEPVRFFREGAWENAYVVVARMLWESLTR